MAAQINNTPARTKQEQMQNAKNQLQLVEALLGRVDIIMFPELSTCGDVEGDSQTRANIQSDLAEPLGGPVSGFFMDEAMKSGTWLGFGLFLRQEPHIANSYVLAGPRGQLSFCNQTNGAADRGPAYASFIVKGMKIGAVICRNALSESVQGLIAEAKPDLVAIPSLAFAADIHASNAAEWKSHVLSINYAGDAFGVSTFYYFERRAGSVFRYGLTTEEAAMMIYL